MTIIYGQKIVLRPYRKTDAPTILTATQDPTVRYFTGTQATFTLEQIERYIDNFEGSDDRVGFIIALPETLEAVGEVVILEIDQRNRSAHIRIALFRVEDLNKGYGSEAMRLMVDYGFRTLNLHRLGLDVFTFNARAIHVYEKIGFKQEGLQRDTLFDGERFHSTVVMGILEDEWNG
jgi:RimJ/RimL family protein N-acetyltransferase